MKTKESTSLKVELWLGASLEASAFLPLDFGRRLNLDSKHESQSTQTRVTRSTKR